jgi:Dolichyl-phosphate-mannose-protein mannosyltransferase
MFKNKITLVVTAFCVIKLLLHLIADSNSGFQGDELLHIETGNYPGIGYMEFPPVIGWLAFVQNQFDSPSVFVHHIFSHIASLLIMIIAAKTAIELGGKIKAVFMVLLCILIAPCFGRSHQLFQPVVFSQLFWLLSFYQLVRFTKTLDNKYLLYLILSLSLGFLTKYDISFFIAGLSSLLLFKRTRLALLTKSSWIYILLFLVLISPNLWWQFQYQFPALQMFSRLYETQLDKLTIAGVLKDLIITLNPLTAIIWIAGFIFMFNAKCKELYRPIAISVALSICLLALSKSKAYYFYPAMITLLVFGSIWLEAKILSKRKWLIYPVTMLLLLSGVVLAPFGLNILPLTAFIKFAGIKKKDDRYPIHFQEYYSQSKWQNTLTALKKVYNSLSETERKDCLIWGKHYSQAGAVNLYGKGYQLPKAFSYHGSFYLWAPDGEMPEIIIAFTNGEAGIDFFKTYFNTVIETAKVYNPYADFDKDIWQTIYICKRPKQSFGDLKVTFKRRVFE